MKKCDFCEYSHLENGTMVCKFVSCVKTEFGIIQLMERISKMMKGKL